MHGDQATRTQRETDNVTTIMIPSPVYQVHTIRKLAAAARQPSVPAPLGHLPASARLEG